MNYNFDAHKNHLQKHENDIRNYFQELKNKPVSSLDKYHHVKNTFQDVGKDSLPPKLFYVKEYGDVEVQLKRKVSRWQIKIFNSTSDSNVEPDVVKLVFNDNGSEIKAYRLVCDYLFDLELCWLKKQTVG